MTRRIQLLSKLVLALFVACTFATFGAWSILLTSLCSDPRTPVPETQHVIAYSCHGMTVFTSPREHAMLYWLIPVLVLFIFLSVLAAAMVILATANVRIAVQIDVADAASRDATHESGRD